MKWISVKERLPSKDGMYLIFNDCCPKPDKNGLVRMVYNPSRIELVGYFAEPVNRFDHPSPHITHWMPLPCFPKEQK